MYGFFAQNHIKPGRNTSLRSQHLVIEEESSEIQDHLPILISKPIWAITLYQKQSYFIVSAILTSEVNSIKKN